MKFQKIILVIVALIATNLSAFEPFTLSFTDRAENNKPNASATIDVRLTLVNRYTGQDIGTPTPTYQHTVANVNTNAYGMFSVVFEPVAWKNADFNTPDFTNGYNNYALRIETKPNGSGAYKQIGVLAIGNLINNTVVTEAISGPAKSNFKITFNNGALVTIPDEGASVEFPFKVAGFTPETIVKPIPSEGYTLSITAYNKADGTGTAKLTRKMGSTLLAATEATLIADNGNGKSLLAAVPFNVYIGHSSGLVDTDPNYATNRAKLAWIITDGNTILTDNVIKTALVAVYEADDTARRQLELPNINTIADGRTVNYVLTSPFGYCRALSSVSLPAATSIGYGAFYECSSLSSVFLPAATSIGLWVFSFCNSLTTASLPAAISIGVGAFYKCSSLSSVTFGSLITFWGAAVFNGAPTQNIDLTLKTGQTQFDINGNPAATPPVVAGLGKSFGGYTFKEIILK